MTEFNCDEHPHEQIWASSFVPKEIAAQERVIVGYGTLAEAPRDLRGRTGGSTAAGMTRQTLSARMKVTLP